MNIDVFISVFIQYRTGFTATYSKNATWIRARVKTRLVGKGKSFSFITFFVRLFSVFNMMFETVFLF